MIPPRDMFGVEIKIGDWIAYPGRSGSSLWQNVGQVDKISESGNRVFCVDMDGKRGSTGVFRRCCIIKGSYVRTELPSRLLC